MRYDANEDGKVSRDELPEQMRRILERAGVLAPWWQEPTPPRPVWRARATVHQAQHRFGESLVDLDRLLATHAHDHQAGLTRAMVLLALGEYRAALAQCVAVAAHIEPASSSALGSSTDLTGVSWPFGFTCR